MMILLGTVLLPVILEFVIRAQSGHRNQEQLGILINKGDVAGVCQMIKSHPSLINADVGLHFHERATPLMMAAQSGRSEICSNLIAAGANVNVVYEGGETALIRLLEFSSEKTDVLSLLLRHGAGVETRDALGRTPLFLAIEDPYHINTNAVAMLLQHGADPNVTNKYGESLMELARQNITNENVFDELFSGRISNGTNAPIKSTNEMGAH